MTQREKIAALQAEVEALKAKNAELVDALIKAVRLQPQPVTTIVYPSEPAPPAPQPWSPQPLPQPWPYSTTQQAKAERLLTINGPVACL